MAMQQQHYYGHEWKPISENSSNGCFDCNICLDFAHEPIVTLCGHLYCWPCIYKWLHVQSASLASDEHPQCPVCKAEISHTAMVPLYGRGGVGHNNTELERKSVRMGIGMEMEIPPRPSACGAQIALTSPTTTTTTRSGQQQLPYRNPYQNQQHYHDEDDDLLSSSSPMTGFHHPVVGMFGDMVYARVFGNSESLYSYPNSYRGLMGSSSSSNPRLRRQEMQADKSLNRISIFLFCCFLLCLIVF
ncbi:E3 ubiquitin-protein ligase RMA1H1 [Cannabis sativa]|uniref:E3 ubiquitin-protein ligase RMA1H1 n=1 Tax=Cannabis sativa TaxID=3483 RepID=UPI0029C9E16E|nr:E3 ubiquitin-protein ligase RMA1H1 [Cannabis sativa]